MSTWHCEICGEHGTTETANGARRAWEHHFADRHAGEEA